MDYTGGIAGMNFTPITNYNNYLKETESFDVDASGSEFENILNKQISSEKDSNKISGGIQASNIDDLMTKAAVQSTQEKDSVGSFLDNVSDGIGNGLKSVNQKMHAAEKAQEAFAMGEDVSVHDVMIAAEKASLSFQMAMQLRNKVVNIYNELKDIRV